MERNSFLLKSEGNLSTVSRKRLGPWEMNSLSLHIPPLVTDDDQTGGDKGWGWETDSDKLAGIPTGPELGNRGLGGALVGSLLMGNLTLPHHRHSLNKQAQILATFKQLAQTLIRPTEENQT